MSTMRDAPPLPTEPLKLIGYYVKRDWHVLKQARLASFCLIAIGALVSWLIVTYLFIPSKNTVIESKNSIIASRDDRITILERKLKDATESIDLSKLPTWVDKTAIKRPLATEEDLKRDRVIGKTVFVSYIPVKTTRLKTIGPAVYEVSGKTFQNCDLIGPAIIAVGGESVIEHCTLDKPTGSNLESFLLLTQDPYTFGVIPFQNCGILHCHFINIGFMGDATELEALKNAFKKAD
jgi:hypothetical protein